MKVSKRTMSVFAGLLVLSVASAGVYWRISGNKAAAAESEQTGDEADADLPENSAGKAFNTDDAVAVEGAEVIQDTLVMSVSATGEAASRQQTVVKAQVGGQVRAVRALENQALGGGRVVIELDPTEYQLALEDALANQRNAQARYREATLTDDQITDARVRAQRDSLSRVKSGLEGAQIAVKRAEINLLRTRVVTPFAGRVANLMVVPGQQVSAGTDLFTVQAMDPIRLEVKVLEGEISFIAAGRTANVTFSAFPGEVFQGRIESINPIVEKDTRTARVRVTIPNGNGRILPGMYATAQLAARRFPDRLLIPRDAILERDIDRRKVIFVVEDGRAKWRYVTVGLENDKYVEIIEGDNTQMVKPGEIVLVKGHYTVQHDTPVRLVENVDKAEGARALR